MEIALGISAPVVFAAMFCVRLGRSVTPVIKNLLARKQKLIEQLSVTEDADERDKIGRQLRQINTALVFLRKTEPKSEE
ncbi:hypothetical protein CQ12_18590 [Bradyrhizobium jicamae]|uniref:Uncharacterized protein n=1 Tax=Bradyrhizobium jicamae TaxID=280332 RepID=A0A0R3L350_9BRAD|nr:hypothetical protein [Bradyrhizobium jicamae]KRR02228.1 hypothetical protein CQ12_18590 [Bradyrhizobium jicamae]